MPQRNTESWDCVIVGAGPAGLSAAVYMGRFRRKTLVLDDEDGRWSYGQRTENYLGFPRGLTARRLHALGTQQAARFGVRFRKARVTRVLEVGRGFRVTAGRRSRIDTRTVIWATGVQDLWPEFPRAGRLVGRKLFWCIACDGWRARDRRVLLLGDTERAVSTTLQFLTYTRNLTLVTRPRTRLSRGCRDKLAAAGIPVLVGAIKRVGMRESEIDEVRLTDGRVLKPELIFSLYGSRPKTDVLASLGVKLARNGHVRTDAKGRTSLRGFFAAGDVTNRHSHQVVSAVHEGGEAALAANHSLYPAHQRL
jgi:thioredoxin reductase (NADPH)